MISFFPFEWYPSSMRIEPPMTSIRLLSYLKEKLKQQDPLITTKQIRWWVEHHRCRVNGQVELFPSTVIHPADRIDLVMDPMPSLSDIVLSESGDLLVVNKPAWTRSEEISSFFQLPLLHRLDRDTTGILLLGKSQSMIDRIGLLFKTRRIRKTYLAWTSPAPKQHQGTIAYRLKTVGLREGALITTCDPRGLEAITHWKKIEVRGAQSLLQIHPETGRTHQIRAHLAAIRAPIVGDTVYGRRNQTTLRPMLHALAIEFVLDDHLFSFEAPLPPDFT